MMFETSVISFEDSFKAMPEYLRKFSLSIRAIYSDQNVGTSTNTHTARILRIFTALRNKTRDDAKVYVKVILPLTTEFVSSIRQFFEFYEALSYEEWCEMLPVLLEDVKTHKDFAEALRDIHKKLLVPLKKRQDEANGIMTGFNNLQREYKKMSDNFQDKADTKKKYAFALAFVPLVNLIAYPLLRRSAKEDEGKSNVKTVESKTYGAAVVTVAKTLIPALTNFIGGLEKAAGFFAVLEEELKSFQKKGEMSKETDKEERKKIHYKMMSNQAKKIKPSFHAFHAALPGVRTDFEAVPDEGTDQKYIDKWLEEMLAEIKEKSESTVEALLVVLKGIKEICSKT